MRSVLGEMGGQVVDDAVDLGYDHWSACECLEDMAGTTLTFQRRCLTRSYPTLTTEMLPPRSHTPVISVSLLPRSLRSCPDPIAAHVNLRDEWLPYKGIIGQVLLDVSSFAVSFTVTC